MAYETDLIGNSGNDFVHNLIMRKTELSEEQLKAQYNTFKHAFDKNMKEGNISAAEFWSREMYYCQEALILKEAL